MLKQEQLNTNTFFRLITQKSVFTLLVLAPSLLFANDNTQATSPKTTTVYKVTHPDGSITYSDQAQTNSVQLEIAPVVTVPAYKAPSRITATSSESEASFYQSVAITSPSHNSAFHSGTGEVNVSTKIEPALLHEDSIRFSLDGVEVSTQKATTLVLSNVYRGTHTITVEILDKNQDVVLSTSNQFTIHRPIKRSR